MEKLMVKIFYRLKRVRKFLVFWQWCHGECKLDLPGYHKISMPLLGKFGIEIFLQVLFCICKDKRWTSTKLTSLLVCLLRILVLVV